ncbi:alanine racemase [Tepidibacter aestuarii]|uniref:alanine racemase n=1 Tax=Tepidibacter aestuarii TaxID=2925782 RepID=UPI0020BD4D3F|nr:alanine racemase [Tepidibacter aestuarii]CAH2213608.1 Amino-acid racemase [Tepidibacter aestuarii]
MNICELQTPSFLLNLDILEANLKKVQKLCNENNKELWPMTKTHKSTYIAKLQREYGAKGFLVGTIDEAEAFINAGLDNICLAYPIVSKANIKRVIDLSKKARIILSFDGEDGARLFDNELKKENLTMEYLIIINCGLNRLGVSPNASSDLAKKICNYSNLKLIGISTHPGQVYGVSSGKEISEVSKQESESLKIARDNLISNSFDISIVATGSTPTFFNVITDSNINILRPGNYPFYDNIQLSLNVCEENECSLTVLGTIISKPKDDLFIVDVGSKCLGLDKGAHASSLINGFGKVKDHDELEIIGLSEEVGKIRIASKTNLKIGDKIQIIPNHSCSCANMTDYIIGFKNDIVEKIIDVDVRGNSIKPNLI